MKNEPRKAIRQHGIVLAALLIISPAAFATEVSLGTALGLRTYQNEGSFYTSSQIEANVSVDWEKVGVKAFANISFYSGAGSTLESNKVKYNTETKSTREGFGLAPYYIFKNSEKLKVYAGPILDFNFIQSETRTSPASVEKESSDLQVNLGLFFGTKFHASKRIDIFFELPMTTQFARKNLSYKIDGDQVQNYQSDGFGFGGGTSFRPYFTPKLGIEYRF